MIVRTEKRPRGRASAVQEPVRLLCIGPDCSVWRSPFGGFLPRKEAESVARKFREALLRSGIAPAAHPTFVRVPKVGRRRGGRAPARRRT